MDHILTGDKLLDIVTVNGFCARPSGGLRGRKEFIRLLVLRKISQCALGLWFIFIKSISLWKWG
ncbi:hypothetical protein KCP77_17095 [Salmonella enterica subsp. enterica]|nr:hypothetical protein KCP77_17095 [Salmonella enterica subsp. enterica]